MFGVLEKRFVMVQRELIRRMGESMFGELENTFGELEIMFGKLEIWRNVVGNNVGGARHEVA